MTALALLYMSVVFAAILFVVCGVAAGMMLYFHYWFAALVYAVGMAVAAGWFRKALRELSI